MIKNQRQYKITKAKVTELELTLADLRRNPSIDSTLPPKLRTAQIATVKTVLADLKAELAEYDQLRAGDFDIAQLGQIQSVPLVLIKARIAASMTQKDLAKHLKLKEPQVQQYESTNYARASLTRIEQVADVLRQACESAERHADR